MDTPTKPLQKLEKKDMVAQIANIKSANCFLQTNSPNITLANKYPCTVVVHCKVHADHTKGYASYAVQITVSPSLSFCLSFEVGSHFTISYYQFVHVKVRLKMHYLNITSS